MLSREENFHRYIDEPCLICGCDRCELHKHNDAVAIYCPVCKMETDTYYIGHWGMEHLMKEWRTPLEPCPFCGKQPTLFVAMGGFRIECRNEDCIARPSLPYVRVVVEVFIRDFWLYRLGILVIKIIFIGYGDVNRKGFGVDVD